MLAAQQNGGSATALVKCVSRAIVTAVPGMVSADDERVYVGLRGGVLTALDRQKLDVQWRTELGGEFASDLAILSGQIVVITNSEGNGSAKEAASTIRLISGDSGVTAWSSKLAFADDHSIGFSNGSIVIISSDGVVDVLDPGSGNLLRRSKALGKVSGKPALSEHLVAFATLANEVVAVPVKSLDEVQRFPLDFRPTFVAFARKGEVIVGDERGNLSLFYEPVARLSWKFKSGGSVSYAAQTDEGIIMTSFDNFVYLISDYNGDVIWKRRLTGRLVDGGTFIADSFVAIVYGENSAFVLDRKSGKLLDSIPASDRELVSLVPLDVGGGKFAMVYADAVEIYGIGGCGQ